MATTATNPLRLSSRTSHFVLPKQWASMRKAEALEDPGGDGDDVLERGAQLNADRVAVGVEPESGAGKSVLHMPGER